MSNLRANIRNHISVNDDLHVTINTVYPLHAVVRGQDGYLWVELFDTSDDDNWQMISDTSTFGDTYAGTGVDAASIREKVATLVERSAYYAGG